MKKITITTIILVLLVLNSFAQIKVSGKVITAETNEPIIGANVVIKGTTMGTVTDMDGNYSLVVHDSLNAILVFSYIGYISEEINVNNNTLIDIQLAEDICSLEEVVVVGYGVQKTACLTGAVAGVSSSAMTRIRGVSSLRNRKSKTKAQGNTCIYGSYATNNQQVVTTQTNNESYAEIDESGFQNVSSSPLSTFSIDVDNASYTNIRRFLNNGQKPPKDAIRIEEMINYFDYEYEQPENEHPFEIYSEVVCCPWNEKHKLLHIGLQGVEIQEEDLPPSNLIFLIDVSGSMSSSNKLPLVKQSLKLLVNKLRDEDRVSIVVYAGAAGVVLPSTKGSDKAKIKNAINHLSAGGSTAGGQGIQLAYKIARKNFIKNGNNRVILATDGDFNVGMSSDQAMEKLIESEREDNIFLTCLGYGMGNYKDSKMEILADKGNGNYAYIDNIQSAQKVLVNEFGGTMFTIAKDVKLQVEFNPANVQAYRLIGYENRELEAEDFIDDTKDAGELGSGHTVTALYEVIPVGVDSKYAKTVNKLKYRNITDTTTISNELATIKFRYKQPKEDTSIEFSRVVLNSNKQYDEMTANASFASSVALFGMLLRESEYVKEGDYTKVIELAKKGKEYDEEGYKSEFIRLVKTVDGNWSQTASK